MSKEEFLKIQTCVLKVNIHCDGCRQKVKKILQKIDGVYTIKIDSEQGKVTVSGNIDAATLVKKLAKNGKHAEIWGASKANNNNNHQNQLNNQFKNMHIDNGKGGNNKGQGQKNGGNNPPKGAPQGQNPQIQQLQQLQQLKAFQDLKIPPQLMKDMRMPTTNMDLNQKAVKFSLPEDEDMTDDDDYDDDDDYYDDDDDYEDDEMDDMPMHNKKPIMGNGHGGAQMPNMMMTNMMKGVGNAGNNGGNGGGNLKKGEGGGGGGGGNIPVQMNHGGANGGKKGGNGNNNGGNQNQGGGKSGKNGSGQPQDSKNGGGQNKNGNGGGGGGGAGNGNNFNANAPKNGGGMKDMHHGMMPNMMNVGQMGKNMPMPMGQMGNLPMSQMGNLSAVQGLPASTVNGGGRGGAGYFPGGATPEQMAGNNPYYQQQLAAMMMNQQHANGNERFHPMMYARPPPAVNYMPPYPQYPYPPPPGERVDQYSMFSDENTSSCSVM